MFRGIVVADDEPEHVDDVYSVSVRALLLHAAMADTADNEKHVFNGKVKFAQPTLHAVSEHCDCVNELPDDGAGVGAGGLGPGAGVGAGGCGPAATVEVHGSDVMRHWSVPFSTRM